MAEEDDQLKKAENTEVADEAAKAVVPAKKKRKRRKKKSTAVSDDKKKPTSKAKASASKTKSPAKTEKVEGVEEEEVKKKKKRKRKRKTVAKKVKEEVVEVVPQVEVQASEPDLQVPQPDLQALQPDVQIVQQPAPQDFGAPGFQQPTPDSQQPAFQPIPQGFDMNPASQAPQQDVQPIVQPSPFGQSPFEQNPFEQPVQQSAPQDFQQATPDFQPSPQGFDMNPTPQQAVPAPQPDTQPSPFGQSPFEQSAQEPVQQPSPFEQNQFGQNPFQQPSPFEQSVQEPVAQPAPSGDPMKDISIFPDNFDDANNVEEPKVEEPEKPMSDSDYFSTPHYGDSPFNSNAPEQNLDTASDVDDSAPIEAEVISSSSTIEPEDDLQPANDFSLPGENPPSSKGLSNKKSFWNSLSEAGVSKKMIFKSCAGLLILIVIVTFLSLGGISKITNLFSGTNTNNTPNNPGTVTESENIALNNAQVFGKNAGSNSSVTIPSPIKMAQLFGKEFMPLNIEYWQSAVVNSGVFGEQTLRDQLEGDYRIITSIDLLRKMSNAYKVDINDTLNRAISREQALDDYLALMNKLYTDAKEMKAMLTQELSIISTTFNSLEQPKKDLETLFFQNFEQLLANEASKNLNDYINYSKELVVLKARYKALQRIDERFATFLQSFRARIQDLQDNRDALIKGIKVYDVPQSDLELIVPVQLKELE